MVYIAYVRKEQSVLQHTLFFPYVRNVHHFEMLRKDNELQIGKYIIFRFDTRVYLG
jgi:hypothetical protein